MAESPKYHPAFAITNVKSLIPITLEAAGMYHSWAALFKVLCRVHDLTYHFIPPTEMTVVAAYEQSKKADLVFWKRLDVAVLNWIYGSISHDLLTAILLKDDIAQGAWARLESMFQDNKASRASHLEQELADLDFENFSSIDGYSSLPEAYAGTLDFIQNQEPLSSFESCRSRLKLAERTIKNRLAEEGGSSKRPATALVSTTGGNQPSESSASRTNATLRTASKSIRFQISLLAILAARPNSSPVQ
uniref:Retrotransposon Copia-like N-terminal domain-containing protein n=1 Tax=Chenopodium quinoa TaxID=63459 RepID=A0A803MDU1_CHEQI